MLIFRSNEFPFAFITILVGVEGENRWGGTAGVGAYLYDGGGRRHVGQIGEVGMDRYCKSSWDK